MAEPRRAAEAHPSEELLVELVLDELEPARREHVAAHLAGCPACRQLYARYAEVVDQVLLAAPVVEPPPGFSRSVLAAMDLPPTLAAAQPRAPSPTVGTEPAAHGDVAGPPPTGSGPAPAASATGQEVEQSPRRRGVRWLAAVAAAVVLLSGAAGAGYLWSSRSQVTAVAGTPIVTTTAERVVGAVLPSWYARERVLVVTLSDGRPGVTYNCQLVLADGTRTSAGTWALGTDRSGTWVVDAPAQGAVRMEMVTESGKVWATAEL